MGDDNEQQDNKGTQVFAWVSILGVLGLGGYYAYDTWRTALNDKDSETAVEQTR